MKAKLIALVVAGGLAPAAAMAQVTLYGTINVDLELAKRTDATAAGAAGNGVVGPATAAATAGVSGTDFATRQRVESNSSNFGLRGEGGLAGGLKTIWQIESGVSLESGTGTLAARNSYIGLSGDFGKVYYAGAHDSPYKRGGLIQAKDPFFATGIAALYGLRNSPGYNQVAGGAATGTSVLGAAGLADFAARLNNSIFYLTPKFNGLSAEFAYGVNEAKTSSTATVPLNPRVASLSITYEASPFWVSYSRERRNDYFGLTTIATLGGAAGNTGSLSAAGNSADSQDTGDQLGVGYTIGSADLMMLWERLDFTSDPGAAAPGTFVTDYRRTLWMLTATHRIAPHRISTAFGRAGSATCSNLAGTCDAADTGAKQYTLGYVYALAKGSDLYVHWTRIRNERLASYTWGVGTALGAGAGSDPEALALGIRHTF
jgi:predicted porin